MQQLKAQQHTPSLPIESQTPAPKSLPSARPPPHPREPPTLQHLMQNVRVRDMQDWLRESLSSDATMEVEEATWIADRSSVLRDAQQLATPLTSSRTLTAEQQSRAEENRRRAQRRLQDTLLRRGLTSLSLSTPTPSRSTPSTSTPLQQPPSYPTDPTPTSLQYQEHKYCGQRSCIANGCCRTPCWNGQYAGSSYSPIPKFEME